MSSGLVTRFERSCSFFRTFGLQILNVIDITLGGFMLGFGLYMRFKVGESFFSESHTSWLALSSVVLGSIMLLVALTSLLAIMNSGYFSA